MMKRTAATVMVLIAFGFARESAAAVGGVYDNQHRLLADAIRDGKAEGVMKGDTAAKFRKQFQSTGPLLASAQVIENFPRADCKRLAVTYTQKGAVSPKGTGDAILNLRLNYCADGRAPSDQEKGITR